MSGLIQSGYHSPHIAWLRFSNPGKRNALSLAMWKDLPGQLKTLSDNPDLRVLILSGEGDHFSSGGDISEFESVFGTWESSQDFSEAVDAAFEALVSFRTPTLAMIRGGAVGGGCGLALACDIRLADESSFFAITPAKLGIVYPFPEIARLFATVGLSAAKDILFSARILKAKEALRMGLVNQIFAPEDLETAMIDYAQTLAKRSPNSLTVTKKILSHLESGGFTPSQKIQDDITNAFLSGDFKTGYRAFLEKREAEFK